VTVRYFAAARQAAGIGREQLAGGTVGSVLDDAVAFHGPEFARVLSTCRIWVNGEEAGPATTLRRGDEVAVLPPVSGGLQ
jgi:sulfur-carrier protein